jgi:hypothetical protein
MGCLDLRASRYDDFALSLYVESSLDGGLPASGDGTSRVAEVEKEKSFVARQMIELVPEPLQGQGLCIRRPPGKVGRHEVSLVANQATMAGEEHDHSIAGFHDIEQIGDMLLYRGLGRILVKEPRQGIAFGVIRHQ